MPRQGAAVVATRFPPGRACVRWLRSFWFCFLLHFRVFPPGRSRWFHCLCFLLYSHSSLVSHPPSSLTYRDHFFFQRSVMIRHDQLYVRRSFSRSAFNLATVDRQSAKLTQSPVTKAFIIHQSPWCSVRSTLFHI